MSTSLCLLTEFTSTKRGIISDVARTFDILGWLAPTIVRMKILYQQLWELKLAWDEQLPEAQLTQHSEWMEQLPLLASRQQPRCYFDKESHICSISLHGFCDASVHAYAAVVYIRATYDDHSPTCALVTAKTRVAPVKQLSIPRLELCGATLLSKLLTAVRKALDVPLNQVHAWCDSTIVLSLLDGSPRRFKTFVGNRLSTILTNLPPSTWHHVPTQDNPADCASRGLSPRELSTHSLWWDGPPWLKTDPLAMPIQPLLGSGDTPELKVTCNAVIPVTPTWIEERFNSYHMLVHVNAWCRRFISNIRASIHNQPKHLAPHLSCAEIETSEQHLFRLAQQQAFPRERVKLNQNQPISSSSSIIALAPFIDKHGLIRVGGRLAKSHLTYSQNHPIILSSKSRLTYLMFNSKHVSLGHCGPSLVLSATGSRVHVLGARRLSRAIYRSCVTCRQATARTDDGSTSSRPNHTKPTFLRLWRRLRWSFLNEEGAYRRPVIVKTYLAVFVCFATKAAHLEVVSDASTEAFLACLRRFVSRRGRPAHIYSDNGGNFQGTKRDLRELYNLLEKSTTQSAVNAYLLQERVQWHSTPERAPHFGGLWEAAVKSAKTHLKRVIGTQRLDYEEFSTVAAQVESFLNSRPLVSITSHAADGVRVLTPGHFLIDVNYVHTQSCLYTLQPQVTPSMEPVPGDHQSLLEAMVV